jgi:hypothetical protein
VNNGITVNNDEFLLTAHNSILAEKTALVLICVR